MPLPSPPEHARRQQPPQPTDPLGRQQRPRRRASLSAGPALVACTSIVPGVPSGNRTIRHGTPPHPPAALDRQPHADQRVMRAP